MESEKIILTQKMKFLGISGRESKLLDGDWKN